ncbi:MAG: glycoside hydrolase family 43 protein [Brevinematia bacterium]
MKYIENPILKGFNPDPSILRVGNDYYIATSTFEWFPGVQIHHSKDLIHWRLLTRPLKRLSQLNMIGDPDSGGIWAPCLSYSDGLFYLIYTDVKSYDGIFKDCHNYLITSKDIEGEWSEPVYLNSSGFDPSLFHDTDGRKWLLNMVWDHRNRNSFFGGILLQEYDPIKGKLIGPIYNIFKGSHLGITEGPHLYKKDGYYYLVVAEGGTTYEHAVTVARSKNITGPYEIHPENPILTSKGDFSLPLQKAGHGSLVETQNGEWYIAHLCARPLSNKRCPLGRETAIQKIIWKDGWPYLENGTNRPEVKVKAPELPEVVFDKPKEKIDFDEETLDINFQSLRHPITEDWCTLKERKSYLRLYGRESLSSRHNQSLVARRQQSFCYTAETCVEFEPENFQQMAGLVCYYNTSNFYYLYISFEENKGKSLLLLSAQNWKFNYPVEPISLGDAKRIYLKVEVEYEKMQFFYATEEGKWIKIGPILDASTLSDEFVTQYPDPGWGFTGAFVGICCQDLSGKRKHADFDYFIYREK